MKRVLLFALAVTVGSAAYAQQPNSSQTKNPAAPALDLGQLHGNFQLDAQYYRDDSLIGAKKIPEKILSNSFLNLTYTRGSFFAGLRYEAYLNPLNGYDGRYKGSGIPHRYAGYAKEGFEVTIGNFYEQFGNGLILRAYEEKNLGIDNSIDGIRMRYEPAKGVYIKGFIGSQRAFFTLGPGLIRGLDMEVSLNEALQALNESKVRMTLGGSGVSRYQQDDDPIYILPENILALAGRGSIQYDKLTLSGEYAYKVNDPSAVNKYIYKPGEAIVVNLAYATKGLGISLAAKRIDNMNFRSDRTASGNDLTLSFLPAISKQHTYMLPAFYPYATQPNGELGFQGEVAYTFKKGTTLGGKYGTTITLNYSVIHGLDTTQVADQKIGYTAPFFKPGQRYFEDRNIEISKKISPKLKGAYTFMHIEYNKDAVQGLAGFGTVFGYINVLEMSYKISKLHSIRVEAQHMGTPQDMGSWAAALVEYTIAPHYFIAVADQYNYGNSDVKKQIHYYLTQVGYLKNTLRIAAGFSRQREGIVCVGGVCRNVPAASGFTLSVTNSF